MAHARIVELRTAQKPREDAFDPCTALRAILAQRSLTSVFQPILGLGGGQIVGFEGLIRGPADSPLHSPARLFAAAEQCGLTLETEMLCRQIVLESFAALDLPGRLFLNVSPAVLIHPSFQNGKTLEYMREVGIAPDRVTIEITENQPAAEMRLMHDALLHYRGMGFTIALDDLGEGFSSLRLWSELRPEYVKIDKHFIQGADESAVKRQFLKSFQQIAEQSGCHIIAEGIETEGELMAVRSAGIAFGQGYLFAAPSAAPAVGDPERASRAALQPPLTLVSRCDGTAHACTATARDLLVHVDPASPETENNDILARFSADPALYLIPVVQEGKPLSLIDRHGFMDRFAKPFQRDLLGRKPCLREEEAHPLLIVDIGTTIQEISQFVTETQNRGFAGGFVITEHGRYAGVGNWQDLLREITRMQIQAARHANPLTLLPGNVPISEQISRLLASGAPFHACYCDLDNFKPFNDAYGYHRGDELLQTTAGILKHACDPARDFIGHVGGDDFIMLMQSPDWERRCQAALHAFAEASASLVDAHHRRTGGYEGEDRHGRRAFHPLPTLSIGAVHVDAVRFRSHLRVSEAATDAKRQAKGMEGNSLYIDRRR